MPTGAHFAMPQHGRTPTPRRYSEAAAKSNLVIARLIGGLGNQMFQYAAGRALALRCGAELRIDLSGFAIYQRRRYELDTLR